jgi:hypothetical protein
VTPGEFAAKWHGVTTGERASAQSHFLDLCALLGEPGPTEADPTGAWYAFEKGAEKLDSHYGLIAASSGHYDQARAWLRANHRGYRDAWVLSLKW